VFVSLSLVAVTYVGGIGRVSGAVVGGSLVASGIVFVLLDRAAGLGRYQLLASGVAVVVAIVLAPDGVTGALPRLVRALRWRVPQAQR
jgi:ABC-type branched-subunit amino acid transport system permease subunit